MKPIFISGIGTGIGKTVIAAILTEALKADYWKPVQAGNERGTDQQTRRFTDQQSANGYSSGNLSVEAAGFSAYCCQKRKHQRIELERIEQMI